LAAQLSGRLFSFLAIGLLIAGCASENRRPDLPYPAFVVTDDMPDIFLAALPGVRAKEYVSDMRTRASSNRVLLPPEWSGTTGGSPGKSLEIFVLEGKLKFSDFELGPGGYAYVPPGSLGFRLETEAGALILYALDDIDAAAVIRAPIIIESDVVPWQEVRPGLYEKELRADPGTGARTWLVRLDPGMAPPFTSSSTMREGYLVEGELRHTECFEGEARTAGYFPGGYFRRPPDTVNGGPESTAILPSVWFLRERGAGQVTQHARCPEVTQAPAAEDQSPPANR
jgi:hypothetical protein